MNIDELRKQAEELKAKGFTYDKNMKFNQLRKAIDAFVKKHIVDAEPTSQSANHEPSPAALVDNEEKLAEATGKYDLKEGETPIKEPREPDETDIPKSTDEVPEAEKPAYKNAMTVEAEPPPARVTKPGTHAGNAMTIEPEQPKKRPLSEPPTRDDVDVAGFYESLKQDIDALIAKSKAFPVRLNRLQKFERALEVEARRLR